MSGESIAEWQWRMRNADPLGLTRAQRMQSDQAEMLESVNGQWDGMVRTDGRGRPFISLDGAAVRLPWPPPWPEKKAERALSRNA